MNMHTLHNLQEAYLDVYALDEAEGSYGLTPKAAKAFRALYIERARGRGTRKSTEAARIHDRRVNDPDVGHTGRKSPRPVVDGTYRKGMTQSDRDIARQVGSGYADPDDVYFGPQSDGPTGSLPKGKKLTRQRKTGVSVESYDVYDIILSHLLDEGYADCLGSAEIILENMSDEWLEDILNEAEKIAPYEKMIEKSNKLASGKSKSGHHRSAKIYTALRDLSNKYASSGDREKEKASARIHTKLM